MTRLSKEYSILFVEEPTDPFDGNEGTARTEEINERLHVLTPFLHWDAWTVMAERYTPILNSYALNTKESAFWFYSPFYIHLLSNFAPRKIVYDCMDELSAFKNASPNLPEYERDLIKAVDVIFTGGKSLYESKKQFHSNTHCFPSSVDRGHFAKATDAFTEIPHDIVNLPAPRVGFYGVIDERIDMELLKNVAERLPEFSFIMIGPFAKIQEWEAAHHHNIHYLGKRDYPVLPEYLKGFDIAMMPFAINDATKFISPTKTLEFMAAEKPIVSTPIYDVVRDYSEVVKIADGGGQFADGIVELLNEDEVLREKRIEQQNSIIEKTSWDSTVEKMKELLQLEGKVHSM